LSRKRPVDWEHKEAVLLMEWRRLQVGAYPQLRQLFHIPNGGKRNRIAGAKLKAEGVRPGVSDYLLPVMRMNWENHEIEYCGLWIELKVKGNYPTPDQHEFMNDMRDQSYAAYWCFGWEQAVSILMQYMTGKPITAGRDPKPRGSYQLK